MNSKEGNFYNAYRPSSWTGIIGQDQCTTILKKQSQLQRFGHSYLFHGPSGTGKTTTARVLASAMNCRSMNGDGEPCGKCQNCGSILSGSHLDAIELDGARYRGIDEIRDLTYKARFAPLAGKYKVYIIDEAHSLTQDAQNCLLHLLEEPPPYLVIILITTEPDKIIETVQSRCQRFEFQRLPANAIRDKLLMIAKDQGIDFDDAPEMLRDNLNKAVASGNCREAENAFEQMVTLQL